MRSAIEETQPSIESGKWIARPLAVRIPGREERSQTPWATGVQGQGAPFENESNLSAMRSSLLSVHPLKSDAMDQGSTARARQFLSRAEIYGTILAAVCAAVVGLAALAIRLGYPLSFVSGLAGLILGLVITIIVMLRREEDRFEFTSNDAESLKIVGRMRKGANKSIDATWVKPADNPDSYLDELNNDLTVGDVTRLVNVKALTAKDREILRKHLVAQGVAISRGDYKVYPTRIENPGIYIVDGSDAAIRVHDPTNPSLSVVLESRHKDFVRFFMSLFNAEVRRHRNEQLDFRQRTTDFGPPVDEWIDESSKGP